MVAVRMVESCIRDASFVVAHMRPGDALELAASGAPVDPINLGRELNTCHLSMVAIADASPVAWIGGNQPRGHLFQMGFIATPAFRGAVALHVSRWVRRSLVPAMVETGIRRAWADSLEGHDEAHRWLRLLGAVDEGPLVDYGVNGETFRRFAWRRSDFVKDGDDVRSGRLLAA